MNKQEYETYKMQESLQQQNIDAERSRVEPQLYGESQQIKAVLVDETNPKRIVANILLRLRGKMENPDGTQIQIGKPKLNDIGIANIWFILDSHINQNVILSHLTAREITSIMHGLQNDLVIDLALNYKEYEIVNKTDLDAINNSILTNIFFALKRAEGQNEKNWLKGITGEQIGGGSRMQAPRKEGFWGKFRL